MVWLCIAQKAMLGTLTRNLCHPRSRVLTFAPMKIQMTMTALRILSRCQLVMKYGNDSVLAVADSDNTDVCAVFYVCW